MQYFPDPNHTTAGVGAVAGQPGLPEHFNKDLFWNWVGKVDHNFSAERPRLLPLGRERAQRDPATRSAIRSGPAQDGQLPLWRANRAIVGDWVHIFGAGHGASTCAAATPTSWSGAIPRTRSASIRRSSGPRASSASCRARPSAASSRASTSTSSMSLSRGSTPEPEQELHDPAERVADPRRAQHPQRPRHAVDERLQRELQQLRRRSCTFNRQFTRQHAEQQQRARGQRLRLVPARRAGRRQRGLSTRSRTTSGSSWRPGSRTTGASPTS